MSFDLDKDGHMDVRLDSNMHRVELLSYNSLLEKNDFFVLKPDAKTRQRLNDAGKTDWYESLFFIFVQHYLLAIDGTTITNRNRNDVLGNGVFSFDGNDTLYIKGDYETESKSLIECSMPNSGYLAGACRTVSLPEEAPYTFARFVWTDSETGEELSDGTPFVYGRGYTGHIYLKPKKGYYFDRNNLPEDVTINGSTAPVHDKSCVVENSGLYCLQTGKVVTDPRTIKNASFTVPIPGDGAYALRYSKFISADGDPDIYATTHWLSYEGGEYSDFTGTFTEGQSLFLLLSFHCTDHDRHFYKDGSHWLATNIYINGDRVDVNVYDDDIYLQYPVKIGAAAGTLSLSESMIDTLDPAEPDPFIHLDANLSTNDPSYEPELIWRSSDPDIATVELWEGDNRAVIVTAVGYGETKITVMTADGLYTASVPVRNRRPAVREIELDRRSAEVFYPTNKGFTLNATVYPENAGNKRVL